MAARLTKLNWLDQLFGRATGASASSLRLSCSLSTSSPDGLVFESHWDKSRSERERKRMRGAEDAGRAGAMQKRESKKNGMKKRTFSWLRVTLLCDIFSNATLCFLVLFICKCILNTNPLISANKYFPRYYVFRNTLFSSWILSQVSNV